MLNTFEEINDRLLSQRLHNVEKSLVFSFQFSMQLAIFLKHSLTPKVQPAASRADNIYKLQVSGFTLLIPAYKGYMWVLVTTGNI